MQAEEREAAEQAARRLQQQGARGRAGAADVLPPAPTGFRVLVSRPAHRQDLEAAEEATVEAAQCSLVHLTQHPDAQIVAGVTDVQATGPPPDLAKHMPPELMQRWSLAGHLNLEEPSVRPPGHAQVKHQRASGGSAASAVQVVQALQAQMAELVRQNERNSKRLSPRWPSAPQPAQLCFSLVWLIFRSRHSGACVCSPAVSQHMLVAQT